MWIAWIRGEINNYLLYSTTIYYIQLLIYSIQLPIGREDIRR